MNRQQANRTANKKIVLFNHWIIQLQIVTTGCFLHATNKMHQLKSSLDDSVLHLWIQRNNTFVWKSSEKDLPKSIPFLNSVYRETTFEARNRNKNISQPLKTQGDVKIYICKYVTCISNAAKVHFYCAADKFFIKVSMQKRFSIQTFDFWQSLTALNYQACNRCTNIFSSQMFCLTRNIQNKYVISKSKKKNNKVEFLLFGKLDD